jgi:hypothetical protein
MPEVGLADRNSLLSQQLPAVHGCPSSVRPTLTSGKYCHCYGKDLKHMTPSLDLLNLCMSSASRILFVHSISPTLLGPFYFMPRYISLQTFTVQTHTPFVTLHTDFLCISEIVE